MSDIENLRHQLMQEALVERARQNRERGIIDFDPNEYPYSRGDIESQEGSMSKNEHLQHRVRQFDKAFVEIGKHIQKSKVSFSMAGVDVEEEGIPSSAKSVIDYIKSLEEKL